MINGFEQVWIDRNAFFDLIQEKRIEHALSADHYARLASCINFSKRPPNQTFESRLEAMRSPREDTIVVFPGTTVPPQET